jgi:hypothetical protein
MAASFCTNCGHKMTYSFSPPNFCGKCGTKLNASAANASVAPKAVTKKMNNAEEDEWIDDDGNEEYSNSEDLPSISSLAYELENDSTNRQYQLGELFGQARIINRRNRAVSVDDFKERHGKKN